MPREAAGGSGGGSGGADGGFFYSEPVSSNGKNNGNTVAKKLAGAAVVLGLMIGSGAVGASLADNDNNGSGSSLNSGTNGTLVNNAADAPVQPFAKVAAAVQPSVVSIEVTLRGQAVDTGSGFILKDDGTIATNNHVIAPAANNANATINVKFFNGDIQLATIVGRDPATDIAVIKVNNAGKLTPATLGSSSTLHVGDSVLALGSPLGLEGSVASGIVSALHRTVNLGSEDSPSPFGGGQNRIASTVADAIQTDAAINPGNSGGPLVDMNGAVVGINTAIASLGGSAQSGSIGVGFAIPIDEVKSVSEQLIRGETPKHALLGVQILDDRSGGALVQSVTRGGAADKAGLEAGDVVKQFGERKINTADELSAAVRTKKPGDDVTITYVRKGETKTTQVKLGSSTD